MKKTLVIFAHPYLEHSSSNREIINFYERDQHHTFHDLYEEYPDFHIAAFRERKRMKNYDRFVFHFPIIWFGMPPLLRLWIDEVFNPEWLRNPDENPFLGKEVVIVITSSAREEHYKKDGKFKYTVDELISGLIISLELFEAIIKNVFVVYQVEKLTKKDIILQKKKLIEILNG